MEGEGQGPRKRVREAMPRWSRADREAIRDVRARCKSYIAESPPYAEVIGDRKILRFLRGHNNNIEKATEMYIKFLDWRVEMDVDTIRYNIVEGGMNTPSLFPFGETILKLMPQVVCSASALDRFGSPICVEQYDFSPTAVLAQVPLEHHVTFAIYCLEYRSLVVEQLSEAREQAYLASLSPEARAAALREDDDDGDDNNNTEAAPYGVLTNTCVVRDVGKLSYEHVKERELLKTIVVIASQNYPELLRKCFIINAPFIFRSLWYFLRSLLSETTQAKISILGADFAAELRKDVDAACLPALVPGGLYSVGGESPFVFDLAVLGVFPMDAAPDGAGAGVGVTGDAAVAAIAGASVGTAEGDGVGTGSAVAAVTDASEATAASGAATDSAKSRPTSGLSVAAAASAERRRSRASLVGRPSLDFIPPPPPRGCCPRVRRGGALPSQHQQQQQQQQQRGPGQTGEVGSPLHRWSLRRSSGQQPARTSTSDLSGPTTTASSSSSSSGSGSGSVSTAEIELSPRGASIASRRPGSGTQGGEGGLETGTGTGTGGNDEELSEGREGSQGTRSQRGTVSSTVSWEDEHTPVPCTIA